VQNPAKRGLARRTRSSRRRRPRGSSRCWTTRARQWVSQGARRRPAIECGGGSAGPRSQTMTTPPEAVESPRNAMPFTGHANGVLSPPMCALNRHAGSEPRNHFRQFPIFVNCFYFHRRSSSCHSLRDDFVPIVAATPPALDRVRCPSMKRLWQLPGESLHMDDAVQTLAKARAAS
jgi:hypothetical protein